MDLNDQNIIVVYTDIYTYEVNVEMYTQNRAIYSGMVSRTKSMRFQLVALLMFIYQVHDQTFHNTEK